MREIKYFVTHGIFAASIYYGMFKGVEGALNIALFLGWMTSVTVFVLINEKVLESAKERISDPSVPAWLDVSIDLCIVAAFLYSGYFWLGGFYLFHIAILSAARDKAIKMILDAKE